MYRLMMKPVHRGAQIEVRLSVQDYDDLAQNIKDGLARFSDNEKVSVAVEDKYGIFFSKYVDMATVAQALEELSTLKQFTYQ